MKRKRIKRKREDGKLSCREEGSRGIERMVK